MKVVSALFLLLWVACAPFAACAQKDIHAFTDRHIDLIDLVGHLIHKNGVQRTDSPSKDPTKLRISGVPAAGYTLQTGFAGLVTANGAFKTEANANTSIITTSLTYTARKQIIFPLLSNIWTKDNKYNFSSDWRYVKFPSYTYGLGGYTALLDGYLIDYSGFRLHQSMLRKISKNMYAGIGYNIDYFYNIKELDPPANRQTDLQKYDSVQPTEFASGLTFNFLYDDRKNAINADGGNFINVVYRPNLKVFGNEGTWRSLVVDVRKYFKFSKSSENVLALWNYEWLTLSGTAPYLLLPNTGGDPYSNTGRGYIQGRYRSPNMAYLEAEYRFKLTHNGLIGGVVFANAQSFTEFASRKFETITPGWGAGVRIKLNKYSRTNIAIDYGYGLGGSQGLFVNLGEVF